MLLLSCSACVFPFLCVQVRGAYVKLERARAVELGYPSPIWDNIEGTHTNFNRCLDAVLDEVGGGGVKADAGVHGRHDVNMWQAQG